jgi:hypothetical protein
MVRAAAKNHEHVAVATSPADYDLLVAEIRDHGNVTAATRRRFARAAFAHTAAYDRAIVAWLDDVPSAAPGADPVDEMLPPTLTGDVGAPRGHSLRREPRPKSGPATPSQAATLGGTTSSNCPAPLCRT